MSGSAGSGGGSGSARKRLMKEEDMTKVEFETSEEVDVTPTFDTMGLREDLLRGIYAYGEGGEGEMGGGRGRKGGEGRGRTGRKGKKGKEKEKREGKGKRGGEGEGKMGREVKGRELGAVGVSVCVLGPLTAVPTGFEKPSAIQQRAIKQIIKGRDVIAQ